MKRIIQICFFIAFFTSSSLSAKIISQHLTQEDQSGIMGGYELPSFYPSNFMPIPPIQFFGAANICPGQTGNISITNAMDYVDFLWSTNANTPSISINSSGLYTVTVTDATGATTTGSYNVTSNSIINTVDVVATPQTSCGVPDGALNLTIDPPALYTFMWSNGASTEDISILIADHYLVTITDAFGCTYTANFNVPDETNPPVLDIGVSPCTCEQADGNVDLQPLSSTTNLVYEWSSGQITEDILQVLPGFYSVTVTDTTSQCSSIISANIGNTNFVPQVTGTGTSNSGCITPNGEVIIDVSPTVVSYTFEWSNGATSQNLMNVPEGTYTVTVTHGVVCTASATFTVTSAPTVAELEEVITPSLCGLPNGSIDITASPPGLYLYNWSSGQNTEDISGLAPGAYTVTISSTTSVCTATETYIVPETTVNITLSSFNEPTTNCVNPNGSIDLQVSPPGNYSYAWSNGAVTEDIYNLPIGSYTVTVSVSGQCPSEGSFIVEDNLQFTQVSEFVTSSLCGEANGGVDLLLYPLTGNTFHWSNGAVTEDLTNALPGNYVVTVTNPSGCTTVVNYLIPDSDLGLNLTASSTANTSCSTANGAIDLTVSPPGNYSFHWSNGVNTEDLHNLNAGTYTVTVSAFGNCTYTQSFMVTNGSGAPSLDFAENPPTCGLANGSIDLTVSPAGNYMYNWSNGSLVEDPQNLAAGQFTVTVTNANGCSATGSYPLTNSNIDFSTSASSLPNTSCVAPNGSIDLTISQSGSYNILWSNGNTNEDIQGLAAGTYTVTVTLGNNCTEIASYEVLNDAPLPLISPTPNPATCGLGNGNIDLNITPSAGNIFIWSNGLNTQNISSIAPGNYTVTVTAANGCTNSQTVAVPDQPILFNANATIMADTSCLSDNGSIDLTMDTPGNYSFNWSNGAVFEDIQSLGAGNYTVTVTLGQNCTAFFDYTVQNDTPSPQVTAIPFASNCSQPNGSISLTTVPTTGNSFNWSNGQMTQGIQGLLAGNYTVTCTAANGCTTITTVNVPNVNSNFSLSTNVSPNSSCITDNGQVVLNISPVGNYDVVWSNGAATQSLLGIPAGNYSATITDASGCSDQVSAIVDGPVMPQVSIVGPDDACASLGTPVLTADMGFETYNWSNGQSGNSVNASQSGNYSVTATDINGCTAEASHYFTVFPNPVPNINGPTSTCGNGTVYSVPNSFVQIIWSTGENMPSINVTQSGTYMVTVTDQHGCTGTDSQSLTIGTSLVPDVIATISPCDGSAILDAGTGYGTYSWANGATSQTISVNDDGIYAVTVSDGGTCTGTGTVQVDFPALPQVQIVGDNLICSGTSTDFTVPFFTQIQWSTGATAATISASQSGTYTVTVTDINGCTASNDIVLTVAPPLNPGISSDPPNCEGESILDAGPGYSSYNWSNGKTTQSILVSTNGTYTVTVSDPVGIGCTDSASEDVVFPAPPQAEILGANHLCDGDAIVLVTGDTTYTQYLWSTGDTTSQITVTQGGAYAVTVSNAYGCTSSDEWIVAQNPVNTTFLQTMVCSEQDTGTFQTVLTSQFGCDSIVVTNAVLAPPIFSQIDLGACTGESIDFNGVAIMAGGSQTFVYTAANGCDSTVLVTVAAYPAVNFDLMAEKTCWNTSDGVIEVDILSGKPPFALSLDNGNTQQSLIFSNLAGGIHSLNVVDANGCRSTGSMEVPQTVPTQLLVNDAVLPCEIGTVTLQPTLFAENPSQVVWSWPDGSTAPTLTVNQEGRVEVTVDDGCEVIAKTILVAWDEAYHQTSFFYVPNSFSPNYDGINDIFMAYPGRDFELLDFEFRVFDRWGDAMFVTKDIAEGWDGYNRNQVLQPGVFVWFIKAKVLVCGVREVDVLLKGDVSVMR